MTWKVLWEAVKAVFLVLLHALCILAEFFLWRRPLDMPVPLLIAGIGLVWIGVIILSWHHACVVLRWLNQPSPDVQELILEDQRRRELELQRMFGLNPWVDQ